MRRQERKVADLKEIIEIVKSCDVCRIALNNDEFPYIIPLNFGFEYVNNKLYLYFHGAMEGYKLDLIEKNNKASFEMDCNHNLQYFSEKGYCTMSYESVIGCGRIRILNDSEKVHGLNLLMAHYHNGETVYYNPAAIPRTTVYCLEVDNVIGKRKKLK